MGRFKTRLTLASADVREVIKKRLLAKTEDEPEVLTNIYDREKDNFQTLYRFSDNSINLPGWRGSDEFCDFYPFHTYQFDLFQLAIQQLSKHSVFTGKYLSVGERSISPRSTSCMMASAPPFEATCRPPSRWPNRAWVKACRYEF
jgi:hypothetical protein